MKKHLILLGVLLSSQLSMAEDLAPTNVKIVSQDANMAWVKFKDNSNGDFFRFYLDGQPNSNVIGDRKDTTWRNGKSRVVPFKLKRLASKTYKVTIGVIKDNKKVAQSSAIDLTIGEKSNNQAPTIVKVFKGSQRYTWVKFKDNSNADLFRFYFNGEANPEAIKDYKDTTARNGKSRMVPINTTKLAPNSKFDVTIGVIKDGKKVAESTAFTLKTGDAVDVREKIIQLDRELHIVNDPEYRFSRARLLFNEHFGIVRAFVLGGTYTHVYKIDDNNNIEPLHQFDYEAISADFHMYIGFSSYDNDTKLEVSKCIAYHCGTILHSFYDVSDIENIILLHEETQDNG